MTIEEEIEILENALSGALLVPSECAFVNTQVIKICLDTLKTYESWELLIEYEIKNKVRADAIDSCKTVAMETVDNELLVDTLLMRMDKLKNDG